MKNALLKLENVCLTYYTLAAETEAVDNLNLEIEEGEFVSLLGPSGCGKTSILSLISGILKSTSGTLTLNGNIINGPSSEIGYMLQRDQLFEWRTIWQNLKLGLEIQKKDTKENLEYVRELATKYGLDGFLSHYPNQLSGGMRQRAALIRTLAQNPKLLLLDEPFSALDFQTRINVCEDVYDIIRKENKTTLLVTHDISEAISMSDKIALLKSRPTSLSRLHYTNFTESSPLKRRESPNFSPQFEIIWKELNTNEQIRQQKTV